MNLRIAKKIHRAVRRGPRGQAYSSDQIRRACLRVFESPIQVTGKDANWTPESLSGCRNFFQGRAMLVSPRCLVFERRGLLVEVVRRDGQWYIERPSAKPSDQGAT